MSAYYTKLLQVVKISIEGKPLPFLEKPLEVLIREAPIQGDVNQELVNTLGEEYKLQMISGKIRKLVYYVANSFRALVIQIGTTIFSIPENSGNISETLVVQLVANISSQLSLIHQFLDNVVTSREFTLIIKSDETSNNKQEKRNVLSDHLLGDNIWNAPPIIPNKDYYLGTLNSFVLHLTETENEVGEYYFGFSPLPLFILPLLYFNKQSKSNQINSNY